jgi:hypothetical protein
MYKIKFKKSKNVEKKLKGSGVLVVILSSIAFSIYIMSVYAEQEHFAIMQNKYEKNIVTQYEKTSDNIEKFYQDTLELNNKNITRLKLR